MGLWPSPCHRQMKLDICVKNIFNMILYQDRYSHTVSYIYSHTLREGQFLRTFWPFFDKLLVVFGLFLPKTKNMKYLWKCFKNIIIIPNVDKVLGMWGPGMWIRC